MDIKRKEKPKSNCWKKVAISANYDQLPKMGQCNAAVQPKEDFSANIIKKILNQIVKNALLPKWQK
jgi:hypothetical protein